MIKHLSEKYFQVDAVRHKYKCISVFIMISIFLNGSIYGQKLNAEQIYEKVKDAVVVILAYDDSGKLAAQGSGVILNDKGYIVTNYHVLSGNDQIEIMHDEKIIPYVDIIGIDVEKDILILKIEKKRFPSVKIGDVESLKVGQKVYAIGSPLGFENTISEGIISGLRSYEELSKNYIQITASISPGSSGGAVLNDKGELIGISTLTFSDGQNLNFAIPIDEVLNVKLASYVNNESFKGFELYEKGNNSLEKGNLVEAIKYFTDFIEIFPENPDSYFKRGLAKSILNDYKGAMQDYNLAIKINPQDDLYYSNRGGIKLKLEDNRGAILDYNKAIEINPNLFFAYTGRGNAKRNLKNFQGALEDYDNAINIYPDYLDAYFNRGFVKDKLKDYLGAIQDYTKVIGINPSDAISYFNRGFAKYNSGDKFGACLDWSKAGELGDSDAYNLIREYCN
jgi:tetratricopeptide (TPR) repeat protein